MSRVRDNRSLVASLLGMTAATLCTAARLSAQTPAQPPTATIDSGMTREQVVAKLGEPLSSRSYQRFTYLLYKNDCEKTCGMNDLVVLDSGRVIDAVFRSPARHYSGTSSSPQMIPASAARRGKTTSTAVPSVVVPIRKDTAGTGGPPKKPGA